MGAPVDLRSDTVTRPTQGMWEAMRRAELGDDVFGDDPTTRLLEEATAARLGHEAALFVPSGTMGNEIAVRCHTHPGERVLSAEHSHLVEHESGAPAALSGVLVETLPAPGGILDAARVEERLGPPDIHVAPPTLLWVENPFNMEVGRVYPPETLAALHELAARHGLRTHLDGARLFNAAVAQGRPVADLAHRFDSVNVCLSKGLGCPVGSVLCGPRAWIERARRVRKMFGGGMRQTGLLAAAGLYALEHHVERLADDHRRARSLHEALLAQGWRSCHPDLNMVWIDTEGAHELCARLAEHGVLACATSARRLRLVTHLDLHDHDIERTRQAFAELAAARAPLPS